MAIATFPPSINPPNPQARKTFGTVSLLIRLSYYQLFITYDKDYQTPRIWLQGTKPDGTPLKNEEILQDIAAEYAQKTVTIESFPFNTSKSPPCASIHPCKHAQVMQRINTKGVRVDQYLVLFLKFISSVLPTIEYDNTMAI